MSCACTNRTARLSAGEAIKDGVTTKAPDATDACSTLQSSGIAAEQGTLLTPGFPSKDRFEEAQTRS